MYHIVLEDVNHIYFTNVQNSQQILKIANNLKTKLSRTKLQDKILKQIGFTKAKTSQKTLKNSKNSMNLSQKIQTL